MNYLNRLIALVARLHWLTRLTGKPVFAFMTMVRIRYDRMAMQTIPSRQGSISFRGVDEQALKEVLFDREYAFLEDVIREKEAPRILDVGAHIGTFGIWVLDVNPAARVLSVEADPCTYDLVVRNAVSRHTQGQSWTIILGAAGLRDGDSVRFTNAGPSMSHRVDPKGRVVVETISLATLLDRAIADGKVLDLMKVDIEGSEEAFICAAPELLKRVETLVIELHPDRCDVGRVRAVLDEAFDVVAEVPGRCSSKPLLYCRHRYSAPSSVACGE